MPIGFATWAEWPDKKQPARVGRPHRDRKKARRRKSGK